MRNLKATVTGTFLAVATMLGVSDARSERATSGFESVYGKLPADQVEFLSSADRIKSVAKNGAPLAIWETLEHGEKVECLDCIPLVEPLLYAENARTREIAAWWLRRRMLGVFGSGEVYEGTLNTLKSDTDPQRRAYAAYALGEFLASPGIDACATALTGDSDARVRAAAASALGRLNDDGKGALATAMGDKESSVKLASLASATRINAFNGVAQVSALIGDGDPVVRRRAAEVLGAMHAKDAIAGVLALAKGDGDENVRIAATHALGGFHDPSARPTLQAIADGDASSLVRDAAKIALKRL